MSEDSVKFQISVDMPMLVRKDLEIDWLSQRFIPTGNAQVVLLEPASAADTVLLVNKILLGGGSWGSTAMRTNSLAISTYFPNMQGGSGLMPASTALPSMLREGNAVVIGDEEPAVIETVEGPDDQGRFKLTVKRGKSDDYPFAEPKDLASGTPVSLLRYPSVAAELYTEGLADLIMTKVHGLRTSSSIFSSMKISASVS